RCGGCPCCSLPYPDRNARAGHADGGVGDRMRPGRSRAMPYVALDGLRMYYAEHGRPDGPPLVLLHAFMATGEQWRRQIDTFGARYRLIVPDLRGHGRTGNPGGLAAMNHRQFARDVVGLCGALGIDRAAFAGISTGAMLLLSLALDAPDLPEALVLAGGTLRYRSEEHTSELQSRE